MKLGYELGFLLVKNYILQTMNMSTNLKRTTNIFGTLYRYCYMIRKILNQKIHIFYLYLLGGDWRLDLSEWFLYCSLMGTE